MFLCLNNSNCAGNARCISGVCVCTNYAFKNNALTLPIVGGILRDLSFLQYVYILMMILIVSIGLLSNFCSLITFVRDRIRYTVCGVYLIFYSLCAIILILVLLTNLIIAFQYDNYGVRLWSCYGYSFVFYGMLSMCFLMTIAVIVENILNRYFGFYRFRSRRSAIFISLIIFILVFLSNLDRILTRHLILTRSGHFFCTYKPYSSLFWYYLNKITFYSYTILPMIIHIICILITLSKIKRRWYEDILLPSFLNLICLFPYILFHYLSDSCFIHSNLMLIRLHIVLILFLLAPHIFTFIIYVRPNIYYFKEFQQTKFYTFICNDRKTNKKMKELEIGHRLWSRCTSLETIMSISNFKDGFIDTELYNTIKLEV